MYVVINSECNSLPERAQSLTSEGEVLLNFLLSLGYDPLDPPLADLLTQHYQLENELKNGQQHQKGCLLPSSGSRENEGSSSALAQECYVLTPIRWEATHNDAMIVALSNELQLEESAAQSGFDIFSQYLAEEGGVLQYHNAQTWLYYSNQPRALKAKPPSHLVNKSLMPELAQLDNTMYWQKFITESQMLFAAKMPAFLINGLWVWGNAKLKDKTTITVCVDETLYSFAQIVSKSVVLYNPNRHLKDYQILLISDLSILSEAHQDELKSRAVHWYWNNMAYLMSPGRWYTRLWRKLIHAY